MRKHLHGAGRDDLLGLVGPLGREPRLVGVRGVRARRVGPPIVHPDAVPREVGARVELGEREVAGDDGDDDCNGIRMARGIDHEPVGDEGFIGSTETRCLGKGGRAAHRSSFPRIALRIIGAGANPEQFRTLFLLGIASTGLFRPTPGQPRAEPVQAEKPTWVKSACRARALPCPDCRLYC